MKRTRIFVASIAPLLVGLVTCPAHAQQVPIFGIEQEPNNTVETANLLTGNGPLSVSGNLTVGDVDTFLFWITPGPNGLVLAFSNTWTGGNETGTNWNNIRFRAVDPLVSGGISTFGNAGVVGNATSTRPTAGPGLYLFEVWSTTPSPANNNPIIGSQIPGSYQIFNIRGLNGTSVSAALPEPGTLPMLGSILLITAVLRRTTKRTRKGVS